MAVAAKFRVHEIIHRGDGREVKAYPVADTEGTNKSWAKSTPGGSLSLYITNPGAFEQFEVGGEYIAEFRKAAKDE